MAYLGEEIGKLGFGLMRLPRKDGAIDIEETSAMVDAFMDAGFTYFDTAWAYEGSEEAVRKALVERYPRESYQLATKLAAWIKCETREDAIKQFELSLERTGAGYFDYYLLHNLGEHKTHFFEDFDLWNWGLEMKDKGLIKHLGFSFHASPEELEEILIAHPEAEFVQLQINYADWENAAIQSRGVYEVARKYNKPIIIMEPLKGGKLANPPQPVQDILKAADPDASCASWALRYAADREGLITVLSGASSLEQIQDSISWMKDFHGMSEDERATIEKAKAALEAIPIVPCTCCNYCMKVCPVNVGIPGTFEAANIYYIYNDIEEARNRQLGFLVDARGQKRASECIKCGACEEACPQHIKIRDELEKIDTIFREN